VLARIARSGSTWNQTARLANSEPGERLEGFGESVALSSDGNTVLVGAEELSGGERGGWAFTRSGAGWEQQVSPLMCSGPFAEECAVALSGDGRTALVGTDVFVDQR